jgi:primosomal replication protein N
VPANALILSACIAELEALRYTPAGVPALNLRLEHESQTQEAGQARQVKLAVKAVAFGTLAERLAKQPIGSAWRFQGFLGNTRQGKSIVFHIQEFLQD